MFLVNEDGRLVIKAEGHSSGKAEAGINAPLLSFFSLLLI